MSLERLRTFLAAPHKVMERHAEIATDLGGGVDDIAPRVALLAHSNRDDADLLALLPPLDDDDPTWAGRALIVCRYARAAGARGPEVHHRGGPVDVRPHEVRLEGPLTIEADLDVAGTLIVLGDLTVRGALRVSERGRVVVEGLLISDVGAIVLGQLAVGARVRTPVLMIERSAIAKLLDGSTGRAFVERGATGTRVFGRVWADYVAFDECVFDDHPTTTKRSASPSGVDLKERDGAAVFDSLRHAFGM